MEGDSPFLTVREAVKITGLNKRTLQRRCDAWTEGGDRSPYAIKSERDYSGGQHGTPGGFRRLIDRVDAERVAKQRRGELSTRVTAEGYAHNNTAGLPRLAEGD